MYDSADTHSVYGTTLYGWAKHTAHRTYASPSATVTMPAYANRILRFYDSSKNCVKGRDNVAANEFKLRLLDTRPF